MTEQTRKLIDEALKLSPRDRAEIAAILLESVDGEPDDSAEAAWAAEIERRALRAQLGRAPARDWDVVRDEVKRDLSAR